MESGAAPRLPACLPAFSPRSFSRPASAVRRLPVLTSNVVPERDLFANFERMRREMDELFGDVFERTGLSRRRAGFSPAVDVAYASDPPRAIVTAELAGVEIDELELEIQGRTADPRRKPRADSCESDVYQQVEIGRGRSGARSSSAPTSRPSKREARYEDGMLRVELPLATSESSRAGGADRELPASTS